MKHLSSVQLGGSNSPRADYRPTSRISSTQTFINNLYNLNEESQPRARDLLRSYASCHLLVL